MQTMINHEICEYRESIYFGLNLRQFVCSIGAVAAAVGLHFLLSPHIPSEAASWLCIAGAAPFAFFGFFRYNGLSAEQFVWAWLKSTVLTPPVLLFRPRNVYAELAKQVLTGQERQVFQLD